MLTFLSRGFSSIRHTALRPLSNRSEYDVTSPEFWEEESRPIPNMRDTFVHASTQSTRDLTWEKTIDRVVLIGEVVSHPLRFRSGWGFGVHFGLRTRTVILDGSGYKALDQIHRCVIHSEMLQKRAHTLIHTGRGVMVNGQIFYSLYDSSENFLSRVYASLSVEYFELLS